MIDLVFSFGPSTGGLPSREREREITPVPKS